MSDNDEFDESYAVGETEHGDSVEVGFPTMKLRDYFAGQLMGPCYMAVARGHTDGESAQEAFSAARAASRLADALLVEREHEP